MNAQVGRTLISVEKRAYIYGGLLAFGAPFAPAALRSAVLDVPRFTGRRPTASMSDNLSARLEALKDLNLQIHYQAEQAEAKVATANPLIAQLAASGLVADQILLGQFLLLRGYSARFPPRDSGQVIQAALALPGGLGAVVWDSEELASFRDSPNYECEAFWRFLPFEQCEPIVKALITSNLAPLFDQLNIVLMRA